VEDVCPVPSYAVVYSKSFIKQPLVGHCVLTWNQISPSPGRMCLLAGENCSFLTKEKEGAGCWWLTIIILAIQEAEISRITV
jgi:hypothetical protein